MKILRFKTTKLLCLHLLKLGGFFLLMRFLTRRGIRILCYHGVWTGGEGYRGDGMFMGAATFAGRLDCMRKWGFPVVPLDDALKPGEGDGLPACPVVITIDDGWYSTFLHMVPALKRYRMPATIYCDTRHLLSGMPVPHVMARYMKILRDEGRIQGSSDAVEAGDLYREATDSGNSMSARYQKLLQYGDALGLDLQPYIDGGVFSYMSSEQLAEVFRSGIDVQLHTHTHSMHDFSEESVRAEIDENRRVLSGITGADKGRFRHFCYPSGVCASHVGPVLKRLSVESAVTTEQSIAFPDADRFFLPRIMDGEHLTLIEFEAELCGVAQGLRMLRSVIERFVGLHGIPQERHIGKVQ